MSFTNKVVIVTGGSSGIGAATAQLFSERGARVVLVARSRDKLQRIAESCSQGGPPQLVVAADIGRDADAERIIQETINTYGKIDILVNNAAILVFGSLLQGDLVQAYDTTMQVNMRAVIKLTVLATPHLIKSKGCIVNVSSVGGKKMGTKTHLSYLLSKAALDHFTRGAAFELASSGVRVNSVSPGPVRTDILQNSNIDANWDDVAKNMLLGRVSEPEEIGKLILFLASEDAIGITGSDFVCDNGAQLGTKQ